MRIRALEPPFDIGRTCPTEEITRLQLTPIPARYVAKLAP